MPHPLNEQVDRLTSRLRRRGWLTGWSLAGVVVIGAAVVLIGADSLTRWSDPGVRWLASAAWLAAAGWAVYRFLVSPRGGARRPERDEVAHRVEARFPSFGSRLTSSLAFLSEDEDDPTAGSAELRRAVITETQAEAAQLDFDEVVNRLPLRRAAAGLGWLLAAALAAVVLQPSAVATGFTRLVAPWSSVDWPRRNRLAFVDPPARIARGQDFEATLVDKNGPPPADAQIEYRFETPNGRRTERRAPQRSGDQLLAMLDNVQHPFALRATGGDDRAMPWVRVEVVEPPAVDSLTITLTPPAYTGLPVAESGPDLHVIAGADLTFDGVAGEPLASVQIGFDIDLPLGDERYNLPTAEPGSAACPFQAVLSSVRVADDPLKKGATSFTTRYRLQLATPEGLTGETEPRRLRVDADTPPKVELLQPAEDLYVTPRAVVPIRATVEDNLAVRSARLEAPLGAADSDADTPPNDPIELYRGPENPPRREGGLAELAPDRQSIELDWDLAAWEGTPSVGAALEVTLVAEDYLPQEGRTPTPRRITIISDEEFNERIAGAQSRLLRGLKQALGAERAARDKARDAAAEARNDETDNRRLLDRLATLGYDQRRVAELVNDPQQGVGRLAESLLDELAMNRADRPALAGQLERVAEAARGLADRPLPEAARAIADAQRSAESGDRRRIGESLAAADAEQSEVVETLERLTDEMAGWSDLEQFAQELADLEQRQRDLADATRADAAKTAAATRSPAERRADRERLTEAQAELARRFDKLMRGMQQRLEASSGDGDRLAPLADTIAEADDRATAGKLREATRQVREGRLGRAGEAQQQAGEDLRDLLSTLRNQTPSNPEQLAKELREALQRLGKLQEQVDDVLDQRDENDRRRSATQERLGERSDRLGRQLERLTADDAAGSAAEGGQDLNNAAQQSRAAEQQEQRRSTEQAREQLRLAEQQLRQRLQELENDAAIRLLDQLATRAEAYLNQQRRLLEQTVELADNLAPESPEISERAEPLAGTQQALRIEVDEAAEEIAELKVFSLALAGVAGEMGSAAERLGAADPGRATQRHELSAIERLKQIVDALKQPPPPDTPPDEQPPGGEGGGQPPPFDVAELKMLRLMQLDLNSRTRRFESGAVEPQPPRERAETAEKLAVEQRKLADLVQELITRDNKDPRMAPPKEVF